MAQVDYFSDTMSKLIAELSRLPGIGPKTAGRLAFHIIDMPEEEPKAGIPAIVWIVAAVVVAGAVAAAVIVSKKRKAKKSAEDEDEDI